MLITDRTEIQRFIRDYYDQLFTNKMDKLEDIEKLSETYNSTKIN